MKKTADAAVTVLSTEVKAASEAVSRKTKKRDSVALAEVASIGTAASTVDTESTVSGWSRRLRLTRRKGRAKDKKLGRLSTEISAGSQGKVCAVLEIPMNA